MSTRRAFLRLLGLGAASVPVLAKAAPVIVGHDDMGPSYAGRLTADLPTGHICECSDGFPRIGWVRLNGRTIGAAPSGATERANEDTEDLFRLLWKNGFKPKDSVGGRLSVYDFRSNKVIALPDMRSAQPPYYFMKL